MSRSSLHGGGFSAVTIDPCVTTERLGRKDLEFAVYGAEGILESTTLVGRGDGRNLTIETVHAASLGRDSGEGLKFYCRLAQPTKTDDLPAQCDLEKLADLLMASGSVRGPAAPDSGIPAAYTYLGQFIAHEMSDLKVLDGNSITLRSAALDLDSLFGAVPDDPLPTQMQIWKGGVGIGQARSFGPDVMYDDLPRRSDGMALIKDARNDTNLALAQLHLALSKFYQFVFEGAGQRSCDAARRITRRHVQSVVLHDYLRRVCDPETYCDILKNGRRVIHPGGLPNDSPFLIPIEFSAACFRVGHSMVRDSYSEWRRSLYNAELGPLLVYTGPGGFYGDSLSLSERWSINWSAMLPGGPGPSETVNKALGIDLRLADGMHKLPARLFSASLPAQPGSALASVGHATLIRQRLFNLTSGQEIVDLVNEYLGAGAAIGKVDPARVTDSIAAGADNLQAVKEFLRAKDFDSRTPLWLYCLIESQEFQRGCRFGPLTSRIVMETIHAAIEAAPDSIITEDGKTVNFVAGESLFARDTVELSDIVTVASKWPNNPLW